MKGEARRRSSLLKSTKAQRARAEAIALKQERLSVACSNTQLSFPKSPYPVQRSQESRVSHVFKKGSDSFYRSASTSRATITPSLGSTLKKTKTVPSMRASVGVSSPIPDKIARIKEAKEKANNYLRSNSKCAKKVPNFQKLHEQSFNKQKSITTIVKEVSYCSLTFIIRN